MMDVRQDYEDFDGDSLSVHTDGDKKVWVKTNGTGFGVLLKPERVKKLRKQLKQWLKNNGHLKSKGSL